MATGHRLLDLTLGRLIDALLAVPGLVTALALTSILGPSFRNLLLALTVTGWPWYARVYRGVLLRELSSGYVESAIVAGMSRRRLLARHVLPNMIGPIIVMASANLGAIMLNLAALSFLGLGVQPPIPEWGAMINESRIYLQQHPWQVLAPGLCITLAVLTVNLTGDALRDAFDPRLRHLA
jgi:peptide/nickel transport system permease protein